jgi:2-polyprenyl-3-methyl-5-hydroxy-6-metoxy-1,4-benzoquinol methylase
MSAGSDTAENLFLLAEKAALQNRPGDAVRYSLGAMRAAPGSIVYKRAFIRFAAAAPLLEYDPDLAEALRICLETSGVDCAAADVLWGRLLLFHPAFGPLYRRVLKKRLFFGWKNPFEGVSDLTPLLDPFFVLGAQTIVVRYLPFEKFMTLLRAFLLDHPALAALTEAMARYCYNTDYIFDVKPAEGKKVAALRARIENGETADERSLVLLACYIPLFHLKNAKTLRERWGQGALAGLIQQQIGEGEALQLQAQSLEALTDSDDDVSLKVREMYEESPYPRWRELTETDIVHWPEDGKCLNRKGARALIAGCGTGRESAQLAAAWPEAEILAIDMTRASLAYAIAKAAEYHLENVRYKQADILKLDTVLKPDFDYVHCVGVLHHMQDPVRGWEVLAGLVKPGGTMFIGLYGEIPRRSIVAARNFIAQGKYPATAEGMRAFRRDAPKLLTPAHYATLLKALDYYHLNMYRDLLFHVHECRFTLPQIVEALKKLGLVFGGFKLPEAVLAEYRGKFPEDAEALDLDNWQRFEQEFPDTFIHSYKFWCHKNI